MSHENRALSFYAAACHHAQFVAGSLINARALWNHLGFKPFRIEGARAYGEKQGWWVYEGRGIFRLLKRMPTEQMQTLVARL